MFRGDKRNVGAKPEFFCARGWVLVSINYRLSPAVKHPAHVEDAAAAVAWVARNVERYGGDPDRMALIGHSAGALIAALLATDERRLGAHGLGLDIFDAVVLLEGQEYDIEARLEWARRTMPERLADPYSKFGDTPEAWRDITVMRHVAPGKGIPPTLLIAVRRAVPVLRARRGVAEDARRALARGRFRRVLPRRGEGPRRRQRRPHFRRRDESGGDVLPGAAMVRPMREMASGLQFPEGPVALDDGSVLVGEIPRGTVTRVTRDGRLQVVAHCGGGPNGIAIGPDGFAWVCNNGGARWERVLVDTMPVPGFSSGELLVPVGPAGGSPRRQHPARRPADRPRRGRLHRVRRPQAVLAERPRLRRARRLLVHRSRQERTSASATSPASSTRPRRGRRSAR